MGHTKGKLDCEKNGSFLITDNGVAICQQPFRKADARYIVTCWNSHDALLAACEGLLVVISNLGKTMSEGIKKKFVDNLIAENTTRIQQAQKAIWDVRQGTKPKG